MNINKKEDLCDRRADIRPANAGLESKILVLRNKFNNLARHSVYTRT